MIYLPGTGIIESYINPATGALDDQFAQALAFYLWAWFILTVIFTISAMRSSWILFLDLLVLSVELLLLACGYMVGNQSLLTGANSLGFVVAFLSCKLPPFIENKPLIRYTDWAGCAGLWAGNITPFNVPTFAMYKEKQ